MFPSNGLPAPLPSKRPSWWHARKINPLHAFFGLLPGFAFAKLPPGTEEKVGEIIQQSLIFHSL
jgi:hypothetical protein